MVLLRYISGWEGIGNAVMDGVIAELSLHRSTKSSNQSSFSSSAVSSCMVSHPDHFLELRDAQMSCARQMADPDQAPT